MQKAGREALLSFWKVHILHHAGEKPVQGQWLLSELRRHRYEISPVTLCPLPGWRVRHRWRDCKSDRRSGRRALENYRLTARGKAAFKLVREQFEELYDQVVAETGGKQI